MKLLQFKTNINCECCVKSIIPYMEDIKSIKYWDVIINDPDKILEIEGEASEYEITEAIEKAGFKIKRMR